MGIRAGWAVSDLTETGVPAVPSLHSLLPVTILFAPVPVGILLLISTLLVTLQFMTMRLTLQDISGRLLPGCNYKAP